MQIFRKIIKEEENAGAIMRDSFPRLTY